jgi:hypothetical protein
MSVEAVDTHTAPRSRLRWWKEALAIAAFYAVYSSVRNQFGSEAVSPSEALANARTMIDWERAMGLFFEETMQAWFLGAEWFIRFWNIFYGTFHFVVTAVALIMLFRRDPARYPRWRNTLAATTGLALIGFALFPLMPPRLLNDFGLYGGRAAEFRFVDTLAEVGGLWSFDSGTMQKISNQYAAMPSLHAAWALWSVLVLWPMLRRRWVRVLVVAYPVATLFAIVVTANHYWIDAAGGVAVLGVAYLLASAWEARKRPASQKVA